MARKSRKQGRIAVADAETDPFLYGRIPKPFCWGFYDGETYVDFWGDDCVAQFVAYLASRKDPLCIYMHNGGKYDIFFLLGYISNPVRIINGRIVSCFIGIHEIRDSYAIIPVPLVTYQKDEINYEWFEKESRNSHRKEILSYLRGDCEYLFRLVNAFNLRFGDKLTIGSTAMQKLQEFHEFRKGDSEHDEKFRKFYFGGRVQAFKLGEFTAALKVYDVNSMYPHAMRNFKHPVSTQYVKIDNPHLLPNGDIKGFPGCPYFLEVEGHNKGAFPVREKEGLNFNVEFGPFFTTSHEMRVALKYKIFKPTKTIVAYIPCFTGSFDKYVDTYYAEKVATKKSGDKIGEIFAKLLLNSAYGKFAQNPENYFDWLILPYGCWPEDDGRKWELYQEFDEVFIFRTPVESYRYFDVAIAASITGAARSILLEAIQLAENPIYCDTDSLICTELHSEVDEHRLGAWKFEGTFSHLAVCGKKLYGGIGTKPNGAPMEKLASKGIKATFEEILQISRGDSFEWKSQAPNFKLSGEVKFTKRVVKRAVKSDRKNS